MLLKNKFYLLSLFILIILMFASPISARSYSISSFDINYTLNQNGIINVSEILFYNLSGCYTELFIQKPNNLVISNPWGYCSGATCDFIYKPTNTISGEQELILKGNYCDASVIAYFNYDVNNQIRVLVDGTQFYYQLYGGKTEVPTNTEINIYLPGDANKTIPQIHSMDYNLIIAENKINISKHVLENEIIEINLLMPTTWFDINSPNLYIYQDTNYTTSQVQQIDSSWEKDYNKYTISIKPTPRYVYLLIIFLPFLLIFLIWVIFGREYSRKKVGYFGIFERDLPDDSDPIIANYFIKGEFSSDWFSSGITYLVWKRYFDFIKNAKGELIIIRTKKIFNKKDVPYYVSEIYDYLDKYYPNGEVNFEDFKKKLKGNVGIIFSKNFVSEFTKGAAMQTEFREMTKSTKEYYDSWFKESKLFKGTGYTILSIFLFGFLFLFIWICSIVRISLNPIIFFVFFGIIFLFIITSRMFFYKVIFGRFTMEGRLKNLKWEAFKKYITTFSLMKQHPPQSVVIWEQYMVYATAFGVAKKTSKALKMVLPEEFNHNDRFIAYSGFIAMSSSISAATGGSSGSSGGGAGGFGGGGGGGGAR